MTKRSLPQDSTPLSAWGYWQASIQTWADFSQRTGEIVMGHVGATKTASRSKESDADNFASELLRTFSDMNLRHWQNTARLLEGYPSWMDLPRSMTGAALVDWFDKLQRPISGVTPESAIKPSREKEDVGQRPATLISPLGSADDLTRIKGIGPKLSKRLNELGIFHFKQIADWSSQEADWVDDYLASRGRVAREAWITQARKLSANGSTTLH